MMSGVNTVDLFSLAGFLTLGVVLLMRTVAVGSNHLSQVASSMSDCALSFEVRSFRSQVLHRLKTKIAGSRNST
jgi:hypothetical protein